MSLEEVPGTSLNYHLISFDGEGRERPDADGPRSRAAIDAVAKEPITDVFLFSHGWQGDVPAARRQYQATGSAPWPAARPTSSGDAGARRPSGRC